MARVGMPCSPSSCCAQRSGCRACKERMAALLRHRHLWRRAVILLVTATIVSFIIPGAPLSRILRSEDTERRKLLSENEERLQRSQLFLQQYRASLGLTSSSASSTHHTSFTKYPIFPPRQDNSLNASPNGVEGSEPSKGDPAITNIHRVKEDPSIKEKKTEGAEDEDSLLKQMVRDSAAPVSAEVGVTVMAMSRGRRLNRGQGVSYRTQYLTQSLGILLQLLNDTTLGKTYTLTVCNIDDKPHLFTEAQELEDLVPVWRRYSGSQTPPSSLWEKLRLDYVYCLQQTLALGVKYALIVEDDAIAHRQVFHVIEHVIRTAVEPREVSGRHVTSIKLFHPQRLLGYVSFEVERLTELVSLGVVLGAALTLACRKRHKRIVFSVSYRNYSNGRPKSGNQNSPHISKSDNKDDKSHSCLPPSDNNHGHRTPLFLSWLGWSVVVMVLALAVGRANLLELRRLTPHLYQVTPVPSCCTPAVLYTRQGGLNLSRYLMNVTCTARRSTDVRMDEFRDVTGAIGLQVQPNLFSHIGLLSSLRTNEVNPLMVS